MAGFNFSFERCLLDRDRAATFSSYRRQTAESQPAQAYEPLRGSWNIAVPSMMHSLASFPMKTRQAEASLSSLSSFPVDIFICLSMGCAPSLAHYWNYSFTAMGDEVRRVARASRCLSFCDFFGAHPGNGRDSPGLFAISHNLNRGYQKTCATYQGKMASEQVSMMMHGPDHLLVLVHGILASPSDWTYAETELKKKLGSTFLIYASSSNSYAKTFSGIDGAGRRLADEVLNVVKNTESLRKISFLAHSLGGLFARYAIGVLYSSNTPDASPDENLSNSENWSPDKSQCSSKFGKIAGLEPINFITLATPHLGVRGRKQLPFLLGVPVLEKLAAPLAPIFTGQTGRQLFLTDGKPDKPPLLLRMTSDHENMKFISALTAFRSRVLYANVSYDHMVGWRTSSIRRETELIEPPHRSFDGYKHVVNVQYFPPASSDGPDFPPEAAKAKEAAQNVPNLQNTTEYHEIMEEEMIRGLQRLGWKKVDVSFHSAFWPFFAHNNIHVKSEWLYNAGAGVIAHVADSLKQEEIFSFIGASL